MRPDRGDIEHSAIAHRQNSRVSLQRTFWLSWMIVVEDGRYLFKRTVEVELHCFSCLSVESHCHA